MAQIVCYEPYGTFIKYPFKFAADLKAEQQQCEDDWKYKEITNVNAYFLLLEINVSYKKAGR